MEQFLQTISEYAQSEQAWAVVRAIIKIIAGIFLGRIAGSALVRIFGGAENVHRSMLLRRGAFYLIAGLFTVSAFIGLGFDLSVLLGAAGILTVAIGFASQTSASNVISGLFLIGERPFAVGDVIRVDQTTGEVISIDWLSVKLRTFDNLYVRIPNETMIKTQVTNLMHFPIRRFDLAVGVAYKEDLRKVRRVLFEVADRNPLCLEEPAPMFIFQAYADSSINHSFNVWAKRENWLELRNTLPVEVKEAFDREGIEIPFPHRTLYTGAVTDPFPVMQVPAAGAQPGAHSGMPSGGEAHPQAQESHPNVGSGDRDDSASGTV